MRKDLRLGLGIGALATVFSVTFLVVRNHTQNQQASTDPEAAPIATGEVEGDAPEANAAAAPPGGVAGAAGGGVVLPPLQPVQPDGALPQLPKIAAEDPFTRRQVRSGEVPMPGPVGKPGTGKPASNAESSQDWDLLLAHGGPVSGPSASGGSANTGMATPNRSLETAFRATGGRPGNPTVAPRPPQVGGQLSAATGRPYTVRDGETFVSIAKAVYGSSKYYLQIEQANRNVNPNRLQPGQEIVLPELSPEARSSRQPSGPFDRDDDNRPVNARTEYRVDTGDSLYRISMNLYGTPRMVNAIYEANRAAIGPNPERLRFGMILKLPRPAEQTSGK